MHYYYLHSVPLVAIDANAGVIAGRDFVFLFEPKPRPGGRVPGRFFAEVFFDDGVDILNAKIGRIGQLARPRA